MNKTKMDPCLNFTFNHLHVIYLWLMYLSVLFENYLPSPAVIFPIWVGGTVRHSEITQAKRRKGGRKPFRKGFMARILNVECKSMRRKKGLAARGEEGHHVCIANRVSKQQKEMRCMQKCSRRGKKGGLCELGSKGGMESKPETGERRGYREHRRLWWRGREGCGGEEECRFWLHY